MYPVLQNIQGVQGGQPMASYNLHTYNPIEYKTQGIMPSQTFLDRQAWIILWFQIANARLTEVVRVYLRVFNNSSQ